VALTAADKTWITAQIQANAVDTKELAAALAAFKDDFLAVPYGNTAYPTRTVQQQLNDVQGLRDQLMDPVASAKLAPLKSGSGLDRLLRAADAVLAAKPPAA